MGTFTCKTGSDSEVDQHQSHSPVHIREDSITSPFLYIPPHPEHNDKLYATVDAFVPAHYTAEPNAAQSSYSISSHAKPKYYPALEATDVNMQQSRSPAISELGSLTPGTQFSATSNETRHDESQRLIKTPADSSARSNTPSRSRKRLHTESKQSASRSRTSSCSTGGHRSSSQEITSRSSSATRRKSSKYHSSHKAGTYAQIHSPKLRKGDSDPYHRKEDLVSLHRNSCRVFEAGGGSSSSKPDAADGRGSHDSKHSWQRSKTHDRSFTSPTESSALTNRITSLETSKSYCTASPSLAPLLTSTTPSSPTSLSSPVGNSTPGTQRHRTWDPVSHDATSTAALHQADSDGPYKPIPATVIDWTSPSTRRREYEEIDRSTRGVRGMWRKIAPSWCQPGGSRIPFFEEGKGAKEMYEGSVRRFRMDVPDGDHDQNDEDGGGGGGRGGKETKAQSQQRSGSSSRVKWKWIESSSVSPAGTIGRGRDVGEKGGSIINGKWRCLGIMRKTN
ncbi:uncharacterized protein BDCG_00183 [Blastomyces dermatitidis ER-3]|uniref:Uncharacterized protein n=1 Tax=Ajellomyces dermatitidis (strain ER-3 / ATCC MYA-2586) TaxID=559297 RepID=A0ABP2EJV9_AJEDR|nr:uncharacterized protein BDCG_00183 [Blastomyces dermatitidis ER-3]EEQ83378.2 hypothetical protein BDCG_00183 [Blastomyces dermatitidis ER-3]